MSGLLAHLPVLPILLPLLAGAMLAATARRAPALSQSLGLLTTLVGLAVAVALAIRTADGTTLAYRVGDWPAPFGISLAADGLASIMLIVAALVALACQLAAADAVGARAPHFAALVQLQLMGLNGAFLTADLFNLFVFYEVLLIASYALLLHDAKAAQVRAGLAYVFVNLLASTLFLIAAALFYGTLGTLAIPELAALAGTVEADERALVAAATLLLYVVFAIKAALLPLGLWLPATYAAASAPVAALFAVLTKVGVYSALRLHPVLESATALADELLLWSGLATVAFAAIATLAARDLRTLAAWLVVLSAGTMIALLGSGAERATGAALFYLPQSSFAAAALFLVAGLIAAARGADVGDRLDPAPASPRRAPLLGALFALVAMTLVGLPPLSGFVAKLLLLESVAESAARVAIWIVVLGGGLTALVACTRAASTIFWKAAPDGPDVGTPRGALTATLLLVACGLGIVAFATPLHEHALATASQLRASSGAAP